MSWTKASDVVPPLNQWLYILDGQSLQIMMFKTNLMEDAVRFSCFECGFYHHPELTEGYSWALIDREKFIEVCLGCKAEKIRHICGADSHPGCYKYYQLSTINTLADTASKHKRRTFVFYWLFAIATFLIIYISLNLSGLLEMWGKKYIYNNVASPAIHEVASELRGVIETIKGKETNEEEKSRTNALGE